MHPLRRFLLGLLLLPPLFFMMLWTGVWLKTRGILDVNPMMLIMLVTFAASVLKVQPGL